MSTQYTAQRIAETDNGWFVIHNETGKQHAVFCHADANTVEDAIDLIENPPEPSDP